MITGAATPWNYTTNKTVKGGVWGGKKAVIIFVDGSGAAMKCDDFISGPTNPTAFRPGSTADSIFQASSDAAVTWLDATNNPILNPN